MHSCIHTQSQVRGVVYCCNTSCFKKINNIIVLLFDVLNQLIMEICAIILLLI